MFDEKQLESGKTGYQTTPSLNKQIGRKRGGFKTASQFLVPDQRADVSLVSLL